jgi:hypothetical protein
MMADEERYDAYLVVEVVDKNGNVVSEHRIKMRCDPLPFLKDITKVWKNHHPGEPVHWQAIKLLDEEARHD